MPEPAHGLQRNGIGELNGVRNRNLEVITVVLLHQMGWTQTILLGLAYILLAADPSVPRCHSARAVPIRSGQTQIVLLQLLRVRIENKRRCPAQSRPFALPCIIEFIPVDPAEQRPSPSE